MPTANGALRLYRKQGFRGVLRVAFNRLILRRPDSPYQVKVSSGAPVRFALLDAALPSDCASLLDIGSNLGDVTAHFAQRGIWSVGVERSQNLVRAAARRHASVSECAFMHMTIGPGSAARVPAFDAVLVLSVHHHWVREYGPEGASNMLRDLADRTARVMIFEGAARAERYGMYPPDFVDNDEESVTEYLENYLRSTVGDRFRQIVPLGKTPNVGEREPYRWSFALYR